MMPNKDSFHTSSYPPAWVSLLAILLLAFILRLGWLVFFTNAINGEGAEYARIAQNLVQGRGYVGIALEGQELMFPPLYPLLIATGSFLTGDFYVAAQLVSLIAGVTLLLPLFGIARDLYGRKTAYVAIVVAALHPVLVELSATTWVEGLYITLIAAVVYYINRCQYDPKQRYWSLSGGILGLAYLTCPQAVIFPFILLISLWLLNRSGVTFQKAALFVGSFTALALPYVLFLSMSTGEFRLEGKTIVNNELGRRLLSGVPYKVAAYEVTDGLEEKGVWMRPNADLARSSSSVSYRTTLQIMLSSGIGNLKQVLLDLSSSPIFGGPLILPLMALGLGRSTWTRHRALGEVTLLLVVVGSLLAMTTIIHQFATRYYYILIPFLVLWASHGVNELTSWAHGTIVNLRVPRVSPSVCGKAVGGLACVGLISLFAVGAIDMARGDPRAAAMRSAGEWLVTLPGEKTIMDTGTIAAFHAGAQYVPMPLCDSPTALRYADKKGVNFIVVKSWEADARPYLQEWLDSGIPSANVSLIHTFGSEPSRRTLIFRVLGYPLDSGDHNK